MVNITASTPLTQNQEEQQHTENENRKTVKKKDEEINNTNSIILQVQNKGQIPLKRKMVDLFFKYYLPVSYVFFVVFGALVPQPGAFLDHKATNYICVVSIFIISGLNLRSSEMKDAIVSYKAAIFSVISILGVTPLIGGQLTALLNFQGISSNANFTSHNNNTRIQSNTNEDILAISGLGPLEYKVGLTIIFSMPCTISSGIVMVTQLNGHVALAILLTVVCNITGIFTIPLWIKWMVASGVNVKLNLTKLISRLCLTLLLPLVIGKLLRCQQHVRKFVTEPKRKRIIKMLNITFLDVLVWTKVSRTSLSGNFVNLTVINVLFLMGWTIAIHILFIFFNTIGSLVLRLPYEQAKTVIILCSQKTLAVSLSIMAFLPLTFGDHGMIIIAMIVSQITIIVVDSILVAVWVHIDSRMEKVAQGEDIVDYIQSTDVDNFL